MCGIQAAQAVGVHAPRRQLLEGQLRGVHVQRVGHAARAIVLHVARRRRLQAIVALDAQHVRPARGVRVMIAAIGRAWRGRLVEAVRQQRGATMVSVPVVAS
jgi:hypothetical protein